MGMSVTDWLSQYKPYVQNENGTFYAIPKADGGYDFYRIAPDGKDSTVSLADFNAGTKSSFIGNPNDFKAALGDTEGATGGSTGPTAQELAVALQNYQNDIKTIENAYNSGLLTWQEKADSIKQARNSALQARDQNTEQNTAYFQNVSPDAFQSQQANYQNKIFDSYRQNEEVQNRNQARLDLAQQQWGQSLNDAKVQAQQNYQNNIGNYKAGQTQMAALPNYQNEVAGKIASGAILPGVAGGQTPMFASTTNDSYENWKKKPIEQYLG